MLQLMMFMPAVLGAQPSVPLYNAAVPGMTMPIVGLGTGGYGLPNGTGGEYWNDATAQQATELFLANGGRRIDTSLMYNTQKGVGLGIKAANIPRAELFVTSKADCPEYNTMAPGGYNATWDSLHTTLQQLQLDYVDLLLLHWPGLAAAPATPPPCWQPPNEWKACRQESWRALVDIFHAGKARAIGVSNFEPNHIQDIMDTHTLLPAVNQYEYHPYWHTDDTTAFCQAHKIQVNAYSSLGAPDHMAFRPKQMPVLLPNNPTVQSIAAAHGKSPGHVLARWGYQRGFVINPRSKNATHMLENLAIFDFELTPEEVTALAALGDATPANVCGDPRKIP